MDTQGPAWITHEGWRHHDAGAGHPESTARLDAVERAVAASLLVHLQWQDRVYPFTATPSFPRRLESRPDKVCTPTARAYRRAL